MKKILLILILLISTIGISQVRTTTLNNKLILKQTPNLAVVDSIVSKDSNQMLRSTSFADFVTQLGIGSFITDIIEDVTPQLGGGLDLNSFDITGVGNINITGDFQGVDATFSNDVQFSNYPNTRVDASAINFIHTDISGNLLSSPISSLIALVPIQTVEQIETQINVNVENNSWAQSFVANWRDFVLDDGAIYFPNNTAYEIGRDRQNDLSPSFMMVPSATKDGVLYAVKGSQNFTVNRNSIATYIGDDGIVYTAGVNEARFQDGALLAEFQSTNLALRSEEFDNVAWGMSNVTVTNNALIAPDGNLTADKLIQTIGNAQHQLQMSLSTTGDSSYSLYVKKEEIGYIQIASAATGTDYCNFDLINGIVGNFGAAATNQNIEDVGNGWFRCTVTMSTNSNSYRIVLIDSASAPWLQTYNALNSTDGLYIWGAQLEEQSVVTSYIKTEATTVTRLADQITDGGTVNDFNSEEGTWVINLKDIVIFDGTNREITISDGTANNQIQLSFTALGNVRGNIIINGNNASFMFNETAIVQNMKCVFRWSSTSLSFHVNDVEIGEDLTGLTYATNTLDRISFERVVGGRGFQGKAEDTRIFKRSLTDEEVLKL